MYAVPYEYYKNDGIRRYGSTAPLTAMFSAAAWSLWASHRRAEAHLLPHGQRSSICAIDGGKCVDTSMGFTPLVGLPMGTRCGDLDPGVMQFLMNKYGYSIDEMLNILNKKSGVLGVSGVSSDFRDLDNAAENGNERALWLWICSITGSPRSPVPTSPQ